MTGRPRRWLITGVSSGLGAALGRAVIAQGGEVTGTVRTEEAARAFSAIDPDRALPVIVDVTDRRRVFEAFEHQTYDVVVNNAGYCLAGAVETLDDGSVRAQLETNVIGVLNLIQAVLPGMRAAGAGRILNIGSLSGVMGMAGLGAYCASKFALAGLSDTLAAEVAPFGVRVTLVEPGGFRTDFAGRSLKFGGRTVAGYEAQARSLEAGFSRSHGHQPNDPVRGARVLIELAEHPDPPVRFALGVDALARIRSALSSRLDAYCATAALGEGTEFEA